MRLNNYNVETLGQVFTPSETVSKMLSLIENNGRTLEPSCGDGAFSNRIKNCVAIEYDSSKCPSYALNMDFFDYPITEKFDTIIGNPPYVKYKSINEETKSKLDLELFDTRTNLYLFFIYKCVLHLNDGGELIFITPKDFLKATSSIKLNNFLWSQGTFTYYEDLSGQKIFPNHCPDCIIFRFVKGNFNRTVGDKTFCCLNGQLCFLSNDYSIPFSDLFYVKVGGMSGADKIFENEEGNEEFVCSYTNKTGKTKRMFYNTPSPLLEEHKVALLNRKSRKFKEEDWYKWSRDYYSSPKERIYVNQRTRNRKPFFTNPSKSYDSSVIAIFPKKEMDLNKAIELLNEVDWEELGFKNGGRFIFAQKSLENCYLPESFKALF